MLTFLAFAGWSCCGVALGFAVRFQQERDLERRRLHGMVVNKAALSIQTTPATPHLRLVK